MDDARSGIPFKNPGSGESKDKKKDTGFHRPTIDHAEELRQDNKKLQAHIVGQADRIKKLEAKVKALENRPGTEFGTPGYIVAGRDDFIRGLRKRVKTLEDENWAHKNWLTRAHALIATQHEVIDSQMRLITSGRSYTQALDDWEKAKDEIAGGSDDD